MRGKAKLSMKKLNVARARQLRRASTDAEQRLWRHLRNRGLYGHKFSRQEPIGPYVVDFVCRQRRLVVELDGGQHADQATADAKRTTALERLGYRVVRYWNNNVLSNTEGVLERIARELALTPPQPALTPPHPGPLPGGEREMQ